MTPAPSDDGSLRRQIAALEADFARALPERVQRISAGCRRLLLGEITDPELEPLRIDVHRLSGSGTIFGSPDVSAAASVLERSIREALGGGSVDPSRLTRELSELEQAVARRLAERPA